MAHPLFILAHAPNACSHNRYGIVTSRKLGNAVARNRAKRCIREAVRYWHPHLPPGHDMIFIARRPVLDCTPAFLLDAMEIVLRRANLL